MKALAELGWEAKAPNKSIDSAGEDLHITGSGMQYVFIVLEHAARKPLWEKGGQGLQSKGHRGGRARHGLNPTGLEGY